MIMDYKWNIWIINGLSMDYQWNMDYVEYGEWMINGLLRIVQHESIFQLFQHDSLSMDYQWNTDLWTGFRGMTNSD